MSEEVRNAIIEYIAGTGETALATIPMWAEQAGADINEVTAEIKAMLATGVIYYVRKGTVVVNQKKLPGAPPQQKGWDRVKNEPWAVKSLGPQRGQSQERSQQKPGGYRFYNLRI